MTAAVGHFRATCASRPAAVWLSRAPHFELEHVWYLSVASTTPQAITSLLLLKREFQHKLQAAEAGAAISRPAT